MTRRDHEEEKEGREREEREVHEKEREGRSVYHMVPFLAAVMFFLCCSQTLLCIPVLVQVCSLVEGGA